MIDGHSPWPTGKPLRFRAVDPLGITEQDIRHAAPDSVKAITKHYPQAEMLQFHLSVMRRSVCAWASLDPTTWHVPVMSWLPHEVRLPMKLSKWIAHPLVAAAIEKARHEQAATGSVAATAVVPVRDSAQARNRAASPTAPARRPARVADVDQLHRVQGRGARATKLPASNVDRKTRR